MKAQPATFDTGLNQDAQGPATPAPPLLLSKVAQLFPNKNAVIAAVKSDGDVGHDVLALAKQPFFGNQQHCDTLEQIVALQGVEGLVNLVSAVLLPSTLLLNNNENLSAFWQNSKATAAAAGMLAAQLTGVKPITAYTLGLFRDCAIPLMLQKFPNYFSILKQGYTDQAARIISIEDKQIKSNHAIVGHLIARAWHLPKPIVQAINDHHSHRRLMCLGNNQIEKEIDRLCATLKLAEHVNRNSLIYGGTTKNFECDIYKKHFLKIFNQSPQ